MSALDHVAVVIGTAEQWATRGGVDGEWLTGRVAAWVDLCAERGISCLTVRPMGPDGEEQHRPRRVVRPGRCTLVVDENADGRRRLAAVLTGAERTEVEVSARLNAPATGDPDLVVICGPDTQLPVSMVWELAYAELVFIDVPADAFTDAQLGAAMDQYMRRHRRFGGLD